MRIRQISDQDRNRERATENNEEEFTLLSIPRSTYVHKAPSRQGRFISSFSRFPYHCSFVRIYARTVRSYIVFLTISACASIFRIEECSLKSICPSL